VLTIVAVPTTQSRTRLTTHGQCCNDARIAVANVRASLKGFSFEDGWFHSMNNFAEQRGV
jgi:hypothetical protein